MPDSSIPAHLWVLTLRDCSRMHSDNRCGCGGSKGLRQGSQPLETHPSGQSILLEGWKQMGSQPGHTRSGSLDVELTLLDCGGAWVGGTHLPWAQEYLRRKSN